MRRRREALLWLLLPLPILLGYFLTTETVDRNKLRFDAARYASMAEPELRIPVTDELLERARAARHSPEKFTDEETRALLTRLSPFCWRIMTPWLASLIPLETIASFKLLAVLATWFTLTVLCLFLRRCGLPPLTTFVGLLLYSGVHHAVRFGFGNPVYSDYMTQAFLVGGLYGLATGRGWWMPPLLAVGMLHKESLVCLIPVALICRGRGGGWRARSYYLYGAVLLAAPLAVIMLLRAFIEPVMEFEQLGSLWLLLERHLPDVGFWKRFACWTAVGLGVSLPVAALQAEESWRYLRARPHWLALVVVGMVFLWAGDKARLYLYMLPILVLVAAWTMQPAIEHGKVIGRLWVAGTLALHYYYERLNVARISLRLEAMEARVDRLLSELLLVTAVWMLISLLLERSGTLPTRYRRRRSP